MKKYYIDDFIIYTYPHRTTRNLTEKEYGVLDKYIGNKYTRKEIDKIICELITRHPYIDGSMSLKINICYENEKYSGYYHILDFANDNYKNQEINTREVKFEL